MTQHRVIILAAAAALAGATAAAQQPPPSFVTPQRASGAGIMQARAEIRGEGVTGTADLTESRQGTGKVVAVSLTVKGLKPGMHAVHLHAVGKCEPDFAAAGGHFDPGPAGNTDPDANHPYHMGDLPQLEVSADGTGSMKATTTRVTLSDGPLSLFDADGAAIILHGNPDQMITGAPKSGVSGGPRVACGVIQKR
jgi:Cu-Zn family superoxide dismutase